MLYEYLNGIKETLEEIYATEQSEELTQEAEERGETTNFYEYLADVLDIEYIIGGDMTYRGVEIALTLGGPNVYLNTRDGVLKGFWGGDRETLYIDSEIIESIDEVCEEHFDCMR